MNLIRIHLFLFALLVVSLGFAHDSLGQKKKPSKKTLAEEPSNPEMVALMAEGHFTEGMKHFILKDYKEAQKEFLKTFDITQNAGVAYQIANTYSKLIDYDNALKYAKISVNLDAGNPFYKDLLALAQRAKGDFEGALETLRNLTDNHGENHEYFYELAGLYLQMGQLDKAVQTYDRLEAVAGIKPNVTQQKQRILLKLGKKKQALAEGQKLIEAFPQEEAYMLAQSNLLIDQEKYSEAYEVINSLQSKNNNGEVALIEAKIYQKQNNYASYLSALEIAFKDEDVSFQRKKDLMREFLYDETIAKDGKYLAKIAVHLHPDEVDANTLYADFLVMDSAYEQARNYYLKALKNQPQDYQLWERVIQIDFQLKEYDSAAKRSQEALEYYPNQSQVYVMLGSAHFMQQSYGKAKANLEQGRMLAVGTENYWRITTQLGDVYHQLGMHQKSDAAYDEVLSRDPDNVHVLNNYSYYLAARKEKLDKALQMSNRLIRLGGQNPNFFDTHGWVLFARGEFSQAREFLEIAAQQTEDPVIIEHHGDVLFKLGEIEAALAEWKRAKDLEGENADKLADKIDKRMLIE